MVDELASRNLVKRFQSIKEDNSLKDRLRFKTFCLSLGIAAGAGVAAISQTCSSPGG